MLAGHPRASRRPPWDFFVFLLMCGRSWPFPVCSGLPRKQASALRGTRDTAPPTARSLFLLVLLVPLLLPPPPRRDKIFYMPNHLLAEKTIVNIQRTADQWHEFWIQVRQRRVRPAARSSRVVVVVVFAPRALASRACCCCKRGRRSVFFFQDTSGIDRSFSACPRSYAF